MRVISLLLAISCLAVSACGKRVTDANLGQVKPDMSTKEVESILGAPNHMEVPPELKSQEVKTLTVTRYIYEQDGKKVTLTFVGDRLATGGVDGSFGN